MIAIYYHKSNGLSLTTILTHRDTDNYLDNQLESDSMKYENVSKFVDKSSVIILINSSTIYINSIASSNNSYLIFLRI